MPDRFRIIHPDWRYVSRFQVGLPRTVGKGTMGQGVHAGDQDVNSGIFHSDKSGFAQLPYALDPGTGIDSLGDNQRVIPGDFVVLDAGRKAVLPTAGGTAGDDQQIADGKLACYMTVVDTGQMDKEISGGLTCAMPPYILQTTNFKKGAGNAAAQTFKVGEELTLAERAGSGGYLWRGKIDGGNINVDYDTAATGNTTGAIAVNASGHFAATTAAKAAEFGVGDVVQLLDSDGSTINGTFIVLPPTSGTPQQVNVQNLGAATTAWAAGDKLRKLTPKQVPIFGICLDPPGADNEHVLTVQVVMPYIKPMAKSRN